MADSPTKAPAALATLPKPAGELPKSDEARGVRCDAISHHSGKACTKRAVPGGTRCMVHQGHTLLAREKAAARLAEMIDPALTTLDELCAQTRHLPTRLGAVKEILNRTVGPVASERTVSTNNGTPQIVIGVAALLPSATQPTPSLVAAEVIDAEAFAPVEND